MHNTLHEESSVIQTPSDAAAAPRTPEQAAELVFDRFEQMEFAFAEANQATQDLTRALGAAIEQLSTIGHGGAATTNSAVLAQMEALVERISTIETSRPQDKLVDSIEALHRKTDFLPGRLSRTEDLLNALKTQVDDLAESLPGDAPAPERQNAADKDALDALEQRLSIAIRALAAPQEKATATLEGLADGFRATQARIIALESKTAAQIDHHAKAARAQIAAAQDQLDSTAKAAKTVLVDRFDQWQQAATPDFDRLTREISQAVTEQIDARLTEIDGKYSRLVAGAKSQVAIGFDRLTDLETKLDAMHSFVAANPTMAHIDARLGDLEQVIAELGSQVASAITAEAKAEPSDSTDAATTVVAAVEAEVAGLRSFIDAKLSAEHSQNNGGETPQIEQSEDANKLEAIVQSMETHHAQIESRLSALHGPESTDVSKDALETVAELARANRILASANAGEDIVQKHTRFLSDLRLVVAECVAEILKSNALEHAGERDDTEAQ